MKKIFSIVICISLFLTVFSGCSVIKGNTDTENTIRFLNFKPEVAKEYEEIAQIYKEETGVNVIIETAASGNYEQTLMAKMSTNEAPALFQINGPKGLESWKNYCSDLSNTELYKHLLDKQLALSENGKVFAIPYVVEGYGIIYNEELTDKYFALTERSTNFDSMDDIKNFESLKLLVEDMQRLKDKLGVKGVFASTSLKTGDDWRWHTHLANIPLYYEFVNNNINYSNGTPNEISLKYSNNFKNIFDLYINNSVVDRKVLGSKITDESMAEFALGQCIMVQNGNWAWNQISNVKENIVKKDKIKFLPIYTGVNGEENQGICIGTENYIAINSKLSEEKQRLAADFLFWLFSSEKGKDFVLNKLELITPFDTFKENELPTDPLALEVVKWMNKKDINNIPWVFTIFPSQNFKQDLGASLLQYAQGTKDWTFVENTFINKWKNETK